MGCWFQRRFTTMKSLGRSPRRDWLWAGLMLAVASVIGVLPWRVAAQGAVGRASVLPLELLRQVRDHYRSLSSFAMRIEHQDSSGLYPGRYTQRLRWRRGGHFELLVTSKENKRVPDFYA